MEIVEVVEVVCKDPLVILPPLEIKHYFHSATVLPKKCLCEILENMVKLRKWVLE